MEDNKDTIIAVNNTTENEAEIEEIIAKSQAEYAEINGEKTDSSGFIWKMLAIGILVLVVLIARTIIKTKDVTVQRSNSSQTIEAQISNDGKVTSYQVIPSNNSEEAK